ncbi:hypothetical protein D3C87_977350 [compost metagenome]
MRTQGEDETLGQVVLLLYRIYMGVTDRTEVLLKPVVDDRDAFQRDVELAGDVALRPFRDGEDAVGRMGHRLDGGGVVKLPAEPLVPFEPLGT